jgi:hypothetical protein
MFIAAKKIIQRQVRSNIKKTGLFSESDDGCAGEVAKRLARLLMLVLRSVVSDPSVVIARFNVVCFRYTR